ncbi:IS481 family transposase [Streptomyces cathayae]|uniref:IS481 family transposase n=1 Tax=Streptomyces cathayae TaxID=3031124 RepID=A0ABY8KDB2_9ACTN|nr:IS481 family transposase [Streptomyces sp. HUAS 5]WGD44811.1 IS481 family transposase [Streptomyces sp. HUAS 5]
MLGGSPTGEVAARYGASRQTLHSRRRRFEQEGMPGLLDRSRRPRNSPTRLSAEAEAEICELRRRPPRWGARRISHELARRGLEPAPSRATVHRVLSRNGLVRVREQRYPRKYRRWQREAPMHLWQMDLVGGVPLADGRECRTVAGIDDHSRFVVIASVVAVPGARAVCSAFTAAMRRCGVPFEVLTDNGKQFTGRHTRPQPVEVLFERICRENGITQRLAEPGSPTTTGKIERFHRTLREEFLDHVVPFESLAAAQEGIDGRVHAYNHQRPHQALDMVTPVGLFRPHTPVRRNDEPPEQTLDEPELSVEVVEVPVLPPQGTAVECDVRVPPSGEITLGTGRQRVGIHQALAGRTLTVWANHRSVRFLLDGHLVTTVPSRLRPEDIAYLTMRYGARPAGAEPAPAALPRTGSGTAVLAAGEPVEVDRKVLRDGILCLAGGRHQVGFALAGRTVTLRLDGRLVHAIADDALRGTGPRPVPADRLGQIRGARTATSPLPLRPCRPGPSGPSGRCMRAAVS